MSTQSSSLVTEVQNFGIRFARFTWSGMDSCTLANQMSYKAARPVFHDDPRSMNGFVYLVVNVDDRVRKHGSLQTTGDRMEDSFWNCPPGQM